MKQYDIYRDYTKAKLTMEQLISAGYQAEIVEEIRGNGSKRKRTGYFKVMFQPSVDMFPTDRNKRAKIGDDNTTQGQALASLKLVSSAGASSASADNAKRRR